MLWEAVVKLSPEGWNESLDKNSMIRGSEFSRPSNLTDEALEERKNMVCLGN